MPDLIKTAGKERLRYLFMVIAIVSCAAVTYMISESNMGNGGYLYIGDFAVSFRYMPIILLAGIFGVVPAMVCVLLIFLTQLLFFNNLAYMVFIYLVVSVVSSAFSAGRWYQSARKTWRAVVLLALLTGNAWSVTIDLLNQASLLDLNIQYILSDFFAELPECILSVWFTRLFFLRLPRRLLKHFSFGQLYDSEMGKNPVLYFKNRSRLSSKITWIIVSEAMALSIAAAAFSNVLVPDVMDETAALARLTEEDTEYTKELLNKGMEDADAALQTAREAADEAREAAEEAGVPEQITQGAGELARQISGGAEAFNQRMRRKYEQTLSDNLGDYNELLNFDRRRLAFDIKLIMMIMNIAVPIGVLVNYYAQHSIARPIREMSESLKVFADASDEGSDVVDASLLAAADKISALKINSKDEIGELHRSIDTTVHRITENLDRLKREQEMEEDLKVARRANEAKSSFLSNMSHEIRTPINAVLGMNEMILRESEEPSTIEYATNIKNAGKSLLSQVNDILDFSKIEAGKMEILPVQYELSSTINDLVNMISGRAQDKNLKLVVHVDETMPHLLFGDEVRIKQVVTNILTNAVKYTEKGQVTLNIGFEPVKDGDRTEAAEGEEGILITEPEKKIWLTVNVSDTGIGIKEEDLGKLFSPFERIEEIRNRTVEGTGLGMSIVKKLLAMMDTKMIVKSVYGEGSEFSFRVLQEVVNWDAIGDFEATYKKSLESQERYKESFRAPKARILVTDDTKMNLTVIKGLLKQTRVMVDTAESGQQTLSKIRENHYDAIFIDHMMPEMDGIQTLAAMREMSSDENKSAGTPVVALTANAVSGAREMYIGAGFTDYLSKPIDALKLEKLLMNILPEELVLKPGDEGFDEDAESDNKITNDTITCDIITNDTESDSDIMRTLREVRGVDLDAALSATGGEDVLIEVMRDFLLAIPEKTALIEKHVMDENIREYTVQVHALKSSARLIGAMELSAEAARLEVCGNAGDIKEIKTATPALLSDYRTYEEKLSPVVLEDEEKKEPIDAAMLADARESLREAVSAQDFDTADEIFKMLSAYTLPEHERVFWKAVERKLAAVDRDGLLDIL